MSFAEPNNLFIQMVRARIASRVAVGDPQIDPVVHDLFDGGKMLRPELAAVVRSSVNDSNDGRAIIAATSIELLHVASLVHDDLIDASDRRRGRPTVHRRLDQGSAILIGDLLLARGSQDAASLGAEPARVWAWALDQLTTGQLMETRVRRAANRTTHLDYIARKTAALMQATCELVCLADGLSQVEVDAYGSFGKCFGMAYQMADDVLDLVGDPEAMGKPTGSDVRNSIITLPLLDAREREPDAFGNHIDQDDGSLAQLAIASGGIHRALSEILSTMLNAGSDLEKLGLIDEARRLTAWGQTVVFGLLTDQIDASLRPEVGRVLAQTR